MRVSFILCLRLACYSIKLTAQHRRDWLARGPSVQNLTRIWPIEKKASFGPNGTRTATNKTDGFLWRLPHPPP